MSEPVQVNKSVLEVMAMNRKDRRRIAHLHGQKNIPSIKNVTITKAPPSEPLKDDSPSI